MFGPIGGRTFGHALRTSCLRVLRYGGCRRCRFLAVPSQPSGCIPQPLPQLAGTNGGRGHRRRAEGKPHARGPRVREPHIVFLVPHSPLTPDCLRRSLGRTLLEAPAGQAMGQALGINKSLKSLNLSINEIGEKGGVAIANSLLSNDTLVHLKYEQCAYGPISQRLLIIQSSRTL